MDYSKLTEGIDYVFIRKVIGLTFFLLMTIKCADTLDPKSRKFVLEQRSFVVMGLLNRPNVDHQLEPIEFEEFYSREQQRAKIHYYSLGQSLVHFYYDSESQSSLSHSSDSAACTNLSKTLLWSYFMFIGAPSKEMTNLYKELDGRSKDISFLVGTAKLLFLPFLFRDYAKLCKNEERLTTDRPTVCYKLELKFDEKQDHSTDETARKKPFEIFVYYNKQSDGGGNTNYIQEAVASLIRIPKENLEIQFHRHEFLDKKILSEYADLSHVASNKLMDKFAFPTATNCVKLMKDGAKKNLLASYATISLRLSFRARVSSPLDVLEPSIEHFVAFDGFTRMLRVDSNAMTQTQTQTNVFDFRSKRRYIIFTGHKENERLIGAAFVGLDPKLSAKCVSTYLPEEKAMEKADNPVALSTLLLGSKDSQFVYIGKALVRGTATQVYELRSQSLPKWLAPELTDRNKLGKQFKSPEKEKEFRSLLYVAEVTSESSEDSVQFRPLLWEAYLDEESDSSKVLVAEFFDFLWDLSESPDGTQPSDLFSLEKICAESQSNHAMVELRLVEDGLRADKGAVWTTNWLRRNMALMYALRDQLELQTTMVYDMRSQLTIISAHVIDFSFRVAEHPRTLYYTRKLGNGYLTERVPSRLQREKLTSSSINYCIYLAAATRPYYPILMIYNGNNQLCMFDRDTPEAKFEHSNYFEIDPKGPVEIYAIEPHKETIVSLSNSFLRESKLRDLENRLMILQNPDPRDVSSRLDLTELKMRIKEIKVRHLGLPSPEDTKISTTLTRVISGFEIDSSSEGARIVSLKKDESTSGHGVDYLASHERCQARCLEDLECRSYSYCDRWPDFACVLYRENIFTEKVITNFLPGNMTLNGKLKKSLVLEVGDKRRLVVKKSLKCDIHPKRYLEMFEFFLGSVIFQPRSDVQFLLVENEETCASKCFEKTLNAIKSDVEHAKELKELINLKKAGESIEKQINGLRESHRIALSEVCEQFMFQEESLLPEQTDYLKKRATSKEGKGEKLCIIESRAPVDQTSEEEAFKSLKFRVSLYKFDFFKLYERRKGLNLIQSELSQDQTMARVKLYTSSDLTPEDYQSLSKALEEGKNMRFWNIDQGSSCAKACFMQKSPLWPACRSFDMTKSINLASPIPRTDCFLNTGHLETIRKQERTTTLSTKYLDESHYEPRFGLISSQIEVDYEIEMLSKSATIEDSRVFSMLLLLFSIGSGISIGILMIFAWHRRPVQIPTTTAPDQPVYKGRSNRGYSDPLPPIAELDVEMDEIS